MAFPSHHFLQVPGQGFPTVRRGSDPGPSAGTGNSNMQQPSYLVNGTLNDTLASRMADPLGGILQTLPPTLCHTHAWSPQLDHLSQVLRFTQTRMQEDPLQFSPDQVLQVKDDARSFLDAVESAANYCPRHLMQNHSPNLVTTKPAPDRARPCTERHLCLLCSADKRHPRGYRDRQTLRRHVEDSHCARFERHCHIAGCDFYCYRGDKLKVHRRESDHEVSSEDSAIAQQFNIPLTTPDHCWLCLKNVGSWEQWFNCVANHCRINGNSPTDGSEGNGSGKRDDDDDNGNGPYDKNIYGADPGHILFGAGSLFGSGGGSSSGSSFFNNSNWGYRWATAGDISDHGPTDTSGPAKGSFSCISQPCSNYNAAS